MQKSVETIQLFTYILHKQNLGIQDCRNRHFHYVLVGRKC